MAVPAPDPLDQMLTRLKLTAVRDQLDSLLDEAARGEMSLRETLALPRASARSRARSEPSSAIGPRTMASAASR